MSVTGFGEAFVNCDHAGTCAHNTLGRYVIGGALLIEPSLITLEEAAQRRRGGG